MTLSKFEKQRRELEEEMKKKLAKIASDEKKEREKRIAPLVSKYTNVFEEVVKKIVTENVERLEGVKFKKTEVKKRLENIFAQELEVILKQAEEEALANSVEGMAAAVEKSGQGKAKSSQDEKPE